MSENTPSSAWILASALTHIHVGVGQAPGVVDLPVVRDSMGYFYIPGSSLKGSIKSTLTRSGKNKEVQKYLGSEPGEKVIQPGTLAFQDLYPLLVPLPSLDRGVIFATTPLLLIRAIMLLTQRDGTTDETINAIRSIENEVRSVFSRPRKPDILLLTTGNNNNQKEKICILTTCQEIESKNMNTNIKNSLESLNQIYSVLLSPKGHTEILVINDTIAPRILDRALIRQTRVRLSRKTKTVETGGLWTEEYVPHFTVFSGAVINTRMKSTNNSGDNQQDNPIGWIIKTINETLKGTVIIGGKETIGKGLLKLKLY